MRTRFTRLLLMCFLTGNGLWTYGQALPPMDAATARRVDSVMELMTLEEKIGQMTLFTSDWDVTGPTLRSTYEADIRESRVGAIFNAHTAAYVKKLQKMAVEETRLGIPLIFGYDVVHGYKTIFPIPLGSSCSWDMEAIEQSAQVAGKEAAAAGLNWTFAPMVDIARDPRWGRMAEGAGEDPYLVSKIAAAYVHGFQGDDLSDHHTVVACAKHFAAYGAAQAGRDYHTVDMSERQLRETYLPPYKAALDAGAGTFMTAFNDVDGVPATGNSFLLRDILRDEWGFEGFVVTDYTSINEMVPHGVVADVKGAAELAATAGVDMDMQGAAYYEHLADLVAEGQVDESTIDEAVRRILYLKFQLGLFDDPYQYVDEAREEEVVFNKEHRALARELARKSMVLLENKDQTLPISAAVPSIALIGPLADMSHEMLGNWFGAGEGDKAVSLRAGLAEAYEGKLIFEKGCEVTEASRDFQKAVEAARQAEVIIAAVGEAGWMSGEAASRSEIKLPGSQLDLLKALKATGKPLVVVVFGGRAMELNWVAEHADALLMAWFPGTEAGHAISDLLFGTHIPSGKLTLSFPRRLGQVPIYHSMKHTGRPFDANSKYTSKYLDVPNTPLYPFGYGLSYTRFAYSDFQMGATEMRMEGTLSISVMVQNTGSYPGTETVQLYVRDQVGSVTRPVRELKGFQQLELAPGQSRRVSFELKADDLAFYTRDMQFKAEPGLFDVWVGGDATTQLGATFSLTDEDQR